jgi:hypothetical protein
MSPVGPTAANCTNVFNHARERLWWAIFPLVGWANTMLQQVDHQPDRGEARILVWLCWVSWWSVVVE